MKYADMHCDTITCMYEKKSHLNKNNLHIDLEKLKLGECFLQNFAIFTNIGKFNSNYTKECIDYYYKELELNKDKIAPIFKFSDIKGNESRGLISSLLTLEDGSIIDDNIENLDFYYSKGVRMISLTWNYITSIGYPNIALNGDRKVNISNFDMENGLTTFGIDVIKRMEELGIIIDVSHLSDKGFYDVLENTRCPFVASHSNSRSVCNVGRNLTDDMIRKLADRGGVTGLNLCSNFIDLNSKNFTTLDGMISHIKHIINIGGIDVMGIGSDFDGIENSLEIVDASGMKKLYQKLEKYFTYDELEKIFYKNVLRVYEEVIS